MAESLTTGNTNIHGKKEHCFLLEVGGGTGKEMSKFSRAIVMFFILTGWLGYKNVYTCQNYEMVPLRSVHLIVSKF